MDKIGERRQKLPLRYPFRKAVKNLREACLSCEDYDPATLFVWGQMMAMGVLRMLEAVEQRFGAEGQEVCRSAINELGKQIFFDMAKGVQVPKDMSKMEVASLLGSWMNEVLYCSIEDAFIKNENEGGCYILYCPHQDVYKPFECRIQRYFVEGVLLGARELWGDRADFDVFFRHSIPQGYETCLFEFKLGKGKEDPWRQYSEELQRRALKHIEREK